MKECREIEPLLASYVDGEASAAERGAIHAHLDQCGACRDAAADERTARQVLVACRERLRARAPDALRTRCAAQRAAVAAVRRDAPALSGWRTLVPLSLAASILLAVAGVFIYSAVSQVEALAAQLAVDHVKCASFKSSAAGDPIATATRWEQANGWPVRVAPSATEHDLEFLTIRRCLVTDGRTAHMMYKWRGEPLSVFVLPNTVEAVNAERAIERFGYGATMWSAEGRTYVVVANGHPQEMEPVVRYVRANAR
jgi:anti-sigma factor RsiW